VITYSYVFALIAYNDMLIMMHTVVRLLILDVVVRQLCYDLTIMCVCCGSCDKKSYDQ
jgi:hypothetical protein